MSLTQLKWEFQTAFTTDSIALFCCMCALNKESVEKQEKVNVNFASKYYQANRKERERKKGRKKERERKKEKRKRQRVKVKIQCRNEIMP